MGTVLKTFNNTVKIRFVIDYLSTWVNKDCIISETLLTLQQLKFILPIQNVDDTSTSIFNDSDADPDFAADESEEVNESTESDLATENLGTCPEIIAVNLCKNGKNMFRLYWIKKAATQYMRLS